MHDKRRWRADTAIQFEYGQTGSNNLRLLRCVRGAERAARCASQRRVITLRAGRRSVPGGFIAASGDGLKVLRRSIAFWQRATVI